MFVIKSRNKRLIMCIMCLILIFTSVYAGMSRVTCFAKERTQRDNSAIGLGMNNTNFVNCCGLDTDGHMSTARDIALMSRELITKYPQIHDYSTIWMDTIIHSTRRGDSEYELTNTNKQIKQYEKSTG